MKRVKVIRAKKWKTEAALEKAIRAFLDKHPGSDELAICDAMGIDLRRACDVLDRMVADGKVTLD